MLIRNNGEGVLIRNNGEGMLIRNYEEGMLLRMDGGGCSYVIMYASMMHV